MGDRDQANTCALDGEALTDEEMDALAVDDPGAGYSGPIRVFLVVEPGGYVRPVAVDASREESDQFESDLEWFGRLWGEHGGYLVWGDGALMGNWIVAGRLCMTVSCGEYGGEPREYDEEFVVDKIESVSREAFLSALGHILWDDEGKDGN